MYLFLQIFFRTANYQVKTWLVSGESGLKTKKQGLRTLYADGSRREIITRLASLRIRCLVQCAVKNLADITLRLV